MPAYRHSTRQDDGTITPSAERTDQSAGKLHDPQLTCCMVALAALEVLTGTRPLAQLARWVSPGVYDALAQRAVLAGWTARTEPCAVGPVERKGFSPPRPNIRRVRTTRLGDHAVESAVVIAHDGRVRAVAIRLESVRGRWRAESLVVG